MTRSAPRAAKARPARQGPSAVVGVESDPRAEGSSLRMGARRVATIARDWEGVRRGLPYLEFATGAPEDQEDGLAGA